MPGRWWISQNLRLFVSSSSSSEWQCDNVMIMTCDFTWFGQKKNSPFPNSHLFAFRLQSETSRSSSEISATGVSGQDPKMIGAKGGQTGSTYATNIDNEHTHGTNSLSKSYNSKSICLYMCQAFEIFCAQLGLFHHSTHRALSDVTTACGVSIMPCRQLHKCHFHNFH